MFGGIDRGIEAEIDEGTNGRIDRGVDGGYKKGLRGACFYTSESKLSNVVDTA
jgi:hypothetical protein